MPGTSARRSLERLLSKIPYRSNTRDMPAFFPKVLYKGRARIEQAVGKLKRFKRIALRCEKTAQNYGSFVTLALGIILIKSVHERVILGVRIRARSEPVEAESIVKHINV